MTIAGMPALNPTTPPRLLLRSALVGVLSGAGGVLWILADAAGAVPIAPLGVFSPPTVAVLPAAWLLEPAAWTGLAGWPHAIAAHGLEWPLKLAGVLLVALGALTIVHPGAFVRPAPYTLPPFRKAVAIGSAFLIGLAIPATALLLAGLLGPNGHPDSGAVVLLGLGVPIFCAFLWTLAGPGMLHPRALIRFAHGGVAGLGIFAALALAALITEPLGAVTEAGPAAFALADTVAGSPGATYCWVLGSLALVYALALALAGAVAVTGAPQSVGPGPRAGAATVALVLLAALALEAAVLSRQLARRERERAPSLVAALHLPATGPARAVVLLPGSRPSPSPVASSHDPEALRLSEECGAAEGGEHVIPAATAAVADSLHRALAAERDRVSSRTAGIIACLVVVQARRFEPARARAVVFDDPVPARLPLAALGVAVRGLLEQPGTTAARRWLTVLVDTGRFRLAPEARERLERLLAAAPEAGVIVTGRLVAPDPALWRVAVVKGVGPDGRVSPWLYAPISESRVLRYMAAAASPGADGAFTIEDVPPGRYQLALLAPEGTSASRLATLSVQGDPGQFVVPAVSRRDLGSIRVSY